MKMVETAYPNIKFSGDITHDTKTEISYMSLWFGYEGKNYVLCKAIENKRTVPILFDSLKEFIDTHAIMAPTEGVREDAEEMPARVKMESLLKGKYD